MRDFGNGALGWPITKPSEHGACMTDRQRQIVSIAAPTTLSVNARLQFRRPEPEAPRSAPSVDICASDWHRELEADLAAAAALGANAAAFFGAVLLLALVQGGALSAQALGLPVWARIAEAVVGLGIPAAQLERAASLADVLRLCDRTLLTQPALAALVKRGLERCRRQAATVGQSSKDARAFGRLLGSVLPPGRRAPADQQGVPANALARILLNNFAITGK
jgi:hypothetical protein